MSVTRFKSSTVSLLVAGGFQLAGGMVIAVAVILGVGRLGHQRGDR